MMLDAPAAMAFAMSPEYRMPPSAINGMSRSPTPSSVLSIAEICGTPTPATMRVVQMEPGPIPTLIPSARSRPEHEALAVATLPTIPALSEGRLASGHARARPGVAVVSNQTRRRPQTAFSASSVSRRPDAAPKSSGRVVLQAFFCSVAFSA